MRDAKRALVANPAHAPRLKGATARNVRPFRGARSRGSESNPLKSPKSLFLFARRRDGDADVSAPKAHKKNVPEDFSPGTHTLTNTHYEKMDEKKSMSREGLKG